ncbi:MAG: signal peptidase I [Spirochaetales bacterium]|nr:signal peptidase I [Spirochaetales bacterium]
MGDQIQIKKRSLILTVLGNILSPGLGFLYNGKFVLSIVNLFIPYLAYVVLVNFAAFNFTVLIICLSLSLVIIYIGFNVLVILIWRGNKRYGLKKYNRAFVYIVFMVLNVVFYLGGYLYTLSDLIKFKSFEVPTRSMEPTLNVGDKFIADMYFYGNVKPQRGDVVIIRNYDDPRVKYSIKRVLCVGPGTLNYENRIFTFNNEIIKDPNEYWDKIIKTVNDKDNEYQIESFNKTLELKEDEVFVIGDNRFNSLDSRFYGPISINRIVGKALYIFMTKEQGFMNRDL